jgi:hypothetical protein
MAQDLPSNVMGLVGFQQGDLAHIGAIQAANLKPSRQPTLVRFAKSSFAGLSLDTCLAASSSLNVRESPS